MKRDHCTKPCKSCPFRRASMPGWLGAASPEGFMISISVDEPLPCHESIDYDSRTWERDWRAGTIGKLCAGALVFKRNRMKLSHDRDEPRLPADPDTVFTTVQEFLDHHNNAPIRSWEMSGDLPRRHRR